MDRLFFSPSFYVMISVKYDIFHMISVRLLECLTPIMWKMDVMSVGEGPLSKKGATFRKLFTIIGGLAFEEMLVFLLSAKARRRCASHSEAV